MKESETNKQTAFYFSSYVHSLKEDLRQTQRWLKQAETHSTNVNTQAVDKYRLRIHELESIIRGVSTEDPGFLAYQEKQISMNTKTKDDYSKRLESSLKEKEEKKQKLEEYYQSQKDEHRRTRQMMYQAKREYERMLSIDASMPTYMRENLETFPNNKGYIFKNVWYFGKQPIQPRRGEDPDVYVLFQKKFPGNTLLIHEVKYGHYHRVYEKKTKDSPKVLVEDRPCIARF